MGTVLKGVRSIDKEPIPQKSFRKVHNAKFSPSPSKESPAMKFRGTHSDLRGTDVGAVVGILRGLIIGVLMGRGERIMGYSRVIRRLESGGSALKAGVGWMYLIEASLHILVVGDMASAVGVKS